MIVRRVAAAASAVAYATGLLQALSWARRRTGRDRLTILAFHTVSAPARPYFRGAMDIDGEQFAQLLRGMRRHYRFRSLSEALDDPDTPAAVVTIDDAYRNIHDVAHPVLKELGIPATLYVPTDYIGTGKLLWWDEVHRLAPDRADELTNRLKYLPVAAREAELERLREAARDGAGGAGGERVMMNWDEIRELAENGFEIGNHTASHPYLSELGPEAIRAELRRAHETIEREVGVAPRSLAYPDGRFNADVVAELKRLGYTSALTTISGSNRAGADPFALRRRDASRAIGVVGGKLRFPLAWAEVLGVWDALLFRKRRSPERFSTFRPATA